MMEAMDLETADSSLGDLFADDANGSAERSADLAEFRSEPGVERISLSNGDCEEFEVEKRGRVLPTPGYPTAS